MTDIEGFLTIYGHSDNLLNNKLGIGKARNLTWFVFARSALFSKKKRGNRFSGAGGENHRKLILKISTRNLDRAGKLKRKEKVRHFLSTEQVIFIN